MKVGDYVRTKKGTIGKIIGYVDDPTDYYFKRFTIVNEKARGRK